jgi:hypothetical protein
MTTKREDARTLLDRELPEGAKVWSKHDGARFARLCGTTHAEMVADWKDKSRVKTGGIMSACNGFAGWYAREMGVTGINSFFKLEASLRSLGKGHAWVPADGKASPEYGDILHHSKGGTGLHVDVCIGFDKAGHLRRAAAGQILFKNPRNPDEESDLLTRVTGTDKYDYHKLLGWMDLEQYFVAAPGSEVMPTTNWVTGWWEVNDGEQYFYYFGNGGYVQYTKKRPATLFAPPKVPLNAGQYSFPTNYEVFIRWNPLDGGPTEENFTTDAGRRKMDGRSNKYGRLVAKRL